nr:hypothetical protein [Amycolatopsis eburnea]
MRSEDDHQAGRVEVGTQNACSLRAADQGRELPVRTAAQTRVSHCVVRERRHERGREAALFPLQLANRLDQPTEAAPRVGVGVGVGEGTRTRLRPANWAPRQRSTTGLPS